MNNEEFFNISELEQAGKTQEGFALLTRLAKCYCAANELATFYVGSDLEKAKFWYREAERHNCRVIQDDRLDT
ncbi:MAG: hypothetical protein Q8N30_15820 [Methylococcales bacterium]|nr:hypothetical protein [Methylococcales bacterium]